jgi:hypothetical protein
MSVNRIGIGTRVGRLTVAEATSERKGGYTVWKCRCDCGGEVDAPLHQLTAGYRVSCGCKSRPPLKDWIGKRFGQLTVLGYAGKSGGMHQWRCLCDCGKETVVGQTCLAEGKTKSCGCLQITAIYDTLKLVDGTSVTRLETGLTHPSVNNTSGHTGVYFNRKRGKWVAEIRFKGQYYYLGSYADKREAIKARQRGEEMHIDFIQQYYEERMGDEESETVGAGKPVAVGI